MVALLLEFIYYVWVDIQQILMDLWICEPYFVLLDSFLELLNTNCRK